MTPRIHILTGLGGRGLVTAPLAAQHVIAGVMGLASPLDVEIAQALHPARFFIRDLRRAQKRRKG
jgi:tRNA 5-methylaminomethyl-2-thiouridine biosynthesis bifunctional protein